MIIIGAVGFKYGNPERLGERGCLREVQAGRLDTVAVS